MAGQLATELDQDYDRTFRRLSAFFRARGVAADEASDLAQETASKVWVHLNRHGRSREDLDPLIYRIAKNVLAEHWRTKGPNAEPIGEENTRRFATLDGIADIESSLHAAWVMEGLTLPQRRAMAMSIEGFKPSEIARELGIKRNAVDQLLHRAKRSLASSIERRGALGGLALFPARMRLRLREWYSAIIGGPLGEAGASQLVALATLSLAATLSFLSPTDSPSTTTPAEKTTQTTPAMSVDRDERGLDGAATDAAASRPNGVGTFTPPSERDDQVDVDVRNHKVGIKKSIEDGEGKEIELIDFETGHERGEGENRGVSGPLLDAATIVVCENAPAACS
jgi:RNA polymerase sigma factor (sigma-70 family)